jgi:hypothetical protein
MSLIVTHILAFLAGCLVGAIISLHSAKMRRLALSTDEEFAAAEASLKAKMAAKQPPVVTPTSEPPKP